MARMSVDDSVQRDPRITRLAQLTGMTRREVVGCLVCDVWPICYDQKSPAIVASMVDVAADRTGFADAMVASGLASWTRGNVKVRIAGAAERIAYLDKKKKAGRVGGLKSAKSRSKNSSITPDDAQARRNPPVPDSAPSPVPDSALVLVPVPVPSPVPEKRRKPSASPGGELAIVKPMTDHQQAIDYFHEAYLAAYGEKPDWKGAPIKLLADLVKNHGLAAVCSKVDRLFAGQHPSWLKPPFTVMTLKAHWNSLVDSTAQDPLMRIAMGLDQ
jgi:hypothetical protein